MLRDGNLFSSWSCENRRETGVETRQRRATVRLARARFFLSSPAEKTASSRARDVASRRRFHFSSFDSPLRSVDRSGEDPRASEARGDVNCAVVKCRPKLEDFITRGETRERGEKGEMMLGKSRAYAALEFKVVTRIMILCRNDPVHGENIFKL